MSTTLLTSQNQVMAGWNQKELENCGDHPQFDGRERIEWNASVVEGDPTMMGLMLELWSRRGGHTLHVVNGWAMVDCAGIALLQEALRVRVLLQSAPADSVIAGALQRTVSSGSPIQPTPDLNWAVQLLRELRHRKAMVMEAEEILANRLKAAIGARPGIAGSLTFVSGTRLRLNTERLRVEDPATFERYSEERVRRSLLLM